MSGQNLLNVDTIATIISAAGIFIAVAALIVQTRQNNRSLQMSLLRDLDKEFFQEMKGQRLALAKFLVNRKPNQVPDGSVADILDFFDGIGIYLRNGALDEESVFYALYYWIKPYWQLLENDAAYLESISEGVANYSSLQLLVSRLTKVAKKTKSLQKGLVHSYSDEKLHAFLQEEIAQCSPTGQSADIEQNFQEIRSQPLLKLRIGKKELSLILRDISSQ